MTPDVAATHTLSLAVWDLPSPIVIGDRTTVKVGVSCSCGCALTGATVDIRDDKGAGVATGCIGPTPWAGTTALHWVELEVAAPPTEGTHTWSVGVIAADTSHEHLASVIHFVSCRLPEHRVSFEVIEKGSGAPLGDVELRIGAFRATTNEMGRAHVDVPGGTYDVHAWKIGFDLLSRTASVGADTTLQLEIPVTLPPEQPYWM